MVQTLESLQRKISSAEDLQSVVTSVKAIAAVNIRHSERAVAALEQYSQSIELALQIVLQNSEVQITMERPSLQRRLGCILFGSDQGFVGQFNRVVAEHALKEMDSLEVAVEERTVLVVGARAAGILEQSNHPVHRVLAIPVSIPHITLLLQEIVLMIESWRSQLGIENLLLFYNWPETGTSYRPRSAQLLPINLDWLKSLQEKPWESNSLPTFSMDAERLFSALVREYFLVSLFEAFVHSMASENASRLASMQSAERNIEEKLTELTHQYHQLRQTSITTEILDIIAGFEALTGKAA